MKIKLPTIQSPQIKRSHYRKTLLCTVVAIAVCHFTYPEMELLTSVVCNFLFYFEPVVTV